jgi:type VI secretion system protein ImpL
VTQRADQFVARSWGGHSIPFSPGFLAGISRLCAAGKPIQEGGQARFELQPVPTPGLCEILLEIDGQRLHYRNGPQVWTGFSWPAADAAPPGARITAVSFQGVAAEVQNAPGRLGLMRLLDQGRVEQRQGGTGSAEWPLKGPGLRGIRFNVRMVSGPDLLRLAALRHHSLPAKITR